MSKPNMNSRHGVLPNISVIKECINAQLTHIWPVRSECCMYKTFDMVDSCCRHCRRLEEMVSERMVCVSRLQLLVFYKEHALEAPEFNYVVMIRSSRTVSNTMTGKGMTGTRIRFGGGRI